MVHRGSHSQGVCHKGPELELVSWFSRTVGNSTYVDKDCTWLSLLFSLGGQLALCLVLLNMSFGSNRQQLCVRLSQLPLRSRSLQLKLDPAVRLQFFSAPAINLDLRKFATVGDAWRVRFRRVTWCVP